MRTIPPLLITVIDAVMWKMFSIRQGVQIGKGRSVIQLMFADDGAILAESYAEKRTCSSRAATAAALLCGLTANVVITRALTTNGFFARISKITPYWQAEELK